MAYELKDAKTVELVKDLKQLSMDRLESLTANGVEMGAVFAELIKRTEEKKK